MGGFHPCKIRETLLENRLRCIVPFLISLFSLPCLGRSVGWTLPHVACLVTRMWWYLNWILISWSNSLLHLQKKRIGCSLSLSPHTHTHNTYMLLCIHIQVCMYIKHFVVAISAVHQMFPVPCLLSICLPGPFVNRQGHRPDTDQWMWREVCHFYTEPIIAAMKPLEFFCPLRVTNKVQDSHHSITWTFEWLSRAEPSPHQPTVGM